VVTEFVRSKKLIKYPRVALTSASQDGYVVTSSGDLNSSYPKHEAFNGVYDKGYTGISEGWISTTFSTSTFTGAPSGSQNGAWLGIQLPVKIKLQRVYMDQRYASAGQEYNKDTVIYASNDGNTWDNILEFDSSSSELFTAFVNASTYYNRYVFHVTSVNHPYGYACFNELELYGTPEYDPEAHGTDVIMRSVPNVPNTDWLEVYYDGQDYTSMPATVTDKSGNGVTGTPSGGVGFDAEYKAFTFDGVDDYISGTLNNTGDFSFTVSIWFYETASNTHTLWMIGSGSSSDNPNPSTALAITSSGSLDFFIFSGLVCSLSTFRATYGTHKWHNVVCTRVDKTLKYFINGVQQNITLTGADEGLSLAANTVFNIGARTGNQLGQNPFQGFISNFRIFERALTGDEIWQLYAYQKEYFGHGVLGMTLKGGRLGIGTSEPRAVLDVKGDIHGGCPVFFSANRSSAIAGAQDVIFNQVHYNKGSGYSGTTGKFTAPLSGYYKFNWHDLTQNSANATSIRPYINNNAVTLPNSSADRYGVYDASLDSVYRNMAGSWIVYLNTGDTFHIRLIDGNLNSNFNCFNGFYLSS
jgi:hypothetical protein